MGNIAAAHVSDRDTKTDRSSERDPQRSSNQQRSSLPPPTPPKGAHSPGKMWTPAASQGDAPAKGDATFNLDLQPFGGHAPSSNPASDRSVVGHAV